MAEEQTDFGSLYQEILALTQEHQEILARYRRRLADFQASCMNGEVDEIEPSRYADGVGQVVLRTQDYADLIAQYALKIEDLEKLERHQAEQGRSADETRGELKSYRAVVLDLKRLAKLQERRYT